MKDQIQDDIELPTHLTHLYQMKLIALHFYYLKTKF